MNIRTKNEEAIPFLQNDSDSDDVVIRIEADEAPNLNQDVMNEIATHGSYRQVLSKLRQTNHLMNELVENTPAGQLARSAHDMEHQPCFNVPESAIRFLMCSSGAGLLATAAYYTAISYFANYPFVSMFFTPLGGAMGVSLGNCFFDPVQSCNTTRNNENKNEVLAIRNKL